MAARGAGRRPAHDRPNRSAVPHGSRADRLSTRCRQPDPSVRRRTLRTVPPATKRRDDPRIALERTRNEITQLERRARRDQASIARRFDAVTDVLRTRGHLDGWTVTESGLTLAGIYHEADLLVTEALTDGLFDGLTAPELASVASCFTYEHRSPTPPPDPWFPSPTAMQRFRQLEVLSQSINAAERRGGVDETRSPDPGFAPVAHSWAAGESLGVLLGRNDEMTAGDFVRNIKQLTDLLGQLAANATDPPRPARPPRRRCHPSRRRSPSGSVQTP